MGRDVDKHGVRKYGTRKDFDRRPLDHAHLRKEEATLAYVKEGRTRRRQRTATGITFTTSFTLTKELDQLLHDMAINDGVSRSSVVRSAVLRYALDRGFVK